MPLISTIVLNYETPGATKKCIEALQRQSIANQLEIIVVDNASRDNSIAQLRSFKEIQTCHPERVTPEVKISILEAKTNLGYGAGNNLGAASARGEFLLIVNPDTALRPDALGKMVQFLKEHLDIGIVGPQLILPDGTIRDSYRTFPTVADIFIKRSFLRFFFPSRMRSYLQWDASPYDTRDTDWIVGACLFLRRDFFQKLHGFDARFFLFFEDTDLCRRCWEVGKRVVYFPEAQADDSEHRLSSGGMFSFLRRKTVRVHLVSAAKYFWKWRRGEVRKVQRT